MGRLRVKPPLDRDGLMPLIKAMLAKGCNQSEISIEIGCSQSCIQKWLTQEGEGMIRISFSTARKRAIERRATDMTGRVWCEQCGAECPTRADYEIDHCVAEGIRPANDNRSPLSADDGRLLCLNCHDKKIQARRSRDRQDEAPGREASAHRGGAVGDRPALRHQAGASQMSVRGLLLALALLASATVPAAAACHRYSVWHYPFPQRCGVTRQMVRLQILANSDNIASHKEIVAPDRNDFGPDRNDFGIALPSLARADLDEPEADEATRARLLLRAALEAANARPLQ